MGLLDDAIREHLDLKRRRGADPAEVERAEQEALGPVRRGPIEAEPPELVLDEDHQPQWDDEFTVEHDVPAPAEAGAPASDADPVAALEPGSQVGPGRFDDEDDPFGDQGSEPEPPRFSAGRPPAEPEYLHDPAPTRPGEHYDDPASAGLGADYAEPFDEPAPPPHRAPLPRDQLSETVEYNLDEALGEAGGGTEEPARPPAQKPPEGADDDPLEETPEFLQETPDHDRLWFEQRPPRDFDFDG